ncbi:MAG: hypothetical protein NT091_04820, partial [Candidatus Falkowbacteria bacterium]|nr:hypothetical protein [Candidatus Falkowbacteria bacterium]
GVADNATGKINGVEYRKSADGKTFTATNASDDGTFKTIHALGEPTSRMLEGWNNGRADIKTMQSAKDQQKIDEHQKKMANLDTAQIKSILTSNLSSNDQKIAAGQILAEKDKISTKEEVEKIKAAIGNSAAALDRFNDALDKSKKSHLNTYDSETRVKRMKEGKINTSSLSSDALKDDNFMRDAYTAKGKTLHL